MNKLIPLIAFSVLLLAPVGAQNAFAQLQAPATPSNGEPNRPLTDENNVIFNGGTSDFVTVGFLDAPGLAFFAEDFVLAQATDLTDVHIDVLQLDPTLTAEFGYVVYADNDGVPGAVIQEGQGVGEHKVSIPDASPADFRYWFDLDNPLPLSAGTTYWITLFVTNSPVIGTISWWTTTPGFGNAVAISSDGVNWVSQPPVQLNLVLTGPSIVGGESLPIDTTALLFASAESTTWIIPLVLSGIGIGLFVFRKSENS